MQFDFGKNWASFSERALTTGRVEQARVAFARLTEGIALKGRSFCDIGFGQGLSLLIAEETGARVVGCDINPLCGEVLLKNRSFFQSLKATKKPPVVIGSILDKSTIDALVKLGPNSGIGNDVVHSWGVLHHTGALWKALEAAAGLTAPGGALVLAIYNRHWTSLIWKAIKWSYCRSPRIAQKILIAVFFPVILAAKAAVTGKNPLAMERGMDFYHDVVDWVGGYPYEYATPRQVEEFMKAKGFDCVRCITARVPTGCNEFVFTRVRTGKG
jgi:SAM-dependent methyltransferase